MLTIQELDFFGKKSKFHHIGMVVRSIQAIQPDLETIADPIQKVRVGFISINGITIELIEPISNDSPVASHLIRGIKLPHICYEVPNLESSIKDCRRHGFHCIGKPVQAKAFQRKIAWVYSKEFGLIELLEMVKQENYDG